MKDPIQSLNNAKDLMVNALSKLKSDDLRDTVTIEIACEKLAAFDLGCQGTEESSKIFRTLHNNGCNDLPAVYWFEIISEHSAQQIREQYSVLKESIGTRTIPSFNKRYDKTSKILYVGKGKQNISGRMFLHLGYEKQKINLQGLQLCHWDYSGVLKGLTLRLNIVYFPKDFREIVPYFERSLAKDILPLIGRHL
ncbi:hypothetical protein [Sphingobacterium bambusae]|uniref:GIY-YIG domain-containing protein n=2 Tax=Sphingobacterium bambusae TaxID=662858 RepID=A0ABW6BE20_9SPHI|nr:hypothetical protein [Sphingobacterium bambusae]WPL47480.1 hypothetical protein SCB77_16120 [Sphingobacterium bambusae]